MTWNTVFGVLNAVATVGGGILSQTVTMSDGSKTSLYLALLATAVNAVGHLWSPPTAGVINTTLNPKA